MKLQGAETESRSVKIPGISHPKQLQLHKRHEEESAGGVEWGGSRVSGVFVGFVTEL